MPGCAAESPGEAYGCGSGWLLSSQLVMHSILSAHFHYAETKTALFFFRYFSTVDMPLQELELLTASGLASL